jgi:hypothetical protein
MAGTIGKISMVKRKLLDIEVAAGLENDPTAVADYERRQAEEKEKAEKRKKKKPVTEEKMRN